MTLSKLEKLIDAENSVKFLLKKQSFWNSEEPIFIRTAEILRKKGRFSEAIQIIQRLAEMENRLSSKTNTLLKHSHAECLLDQRLFVEAIAIYDSILIKVKDPIAYANRGLAYWELRQYKHALKDYRASLRLAPTDAIAQRSAGELLNKLNKHS